MKLMKYLALLVFLSTFAIGTFSSAWGQSQPSEKAIMAFSVNQDQIVNSKAFGEFAAGKAISSLFQMGQKEAEIFEGAAMVKGYIAAPRGGFNPATVGETSMLIVLEMKTEKLAQQVKAEMSAGFVETEMDGKKILKADGFGAPPWFARVDGKRMIIATEDYLFADPNSLPGAELKELLKGSESASAYLAADLDGARELLTELSTLANANADFMTKQYISLIDQVKTIQLSANMDGDPLLSLKLAGHNEKENQQIKLKMEAAVGLLKGITELGIDSMKNDQPDFAKLATELMDGLTVERMQTKTKVSLKRPENFAKRFATAVNLAFQNARNAARKSQDLNKMKMVGLSKHNHFDVYRKFPFDPQFNKNVSWRVRVLPFIEESQLFDRFDIDEKWSSETNRKLINPVPDAFRLSNGATVSYIKPKKLPASFSDVKDGTSNTIVFVENRTAKMTPWTKPEGITPEEFARMVEELEDNDGLIVVFYDGHVRRLTNQTSRETIIKLCNPSDGQIVERGEIK